MKIKFIISFALLFLFIGCFTGCTEKPQEVLGLGVEATFDRNAPFTVLNDSDNNRFSVAYSEKTGAQDLSAFFSCYGAQKPSAFFSFRIYSNDDEYLWSSYESPNDNSVFSFTDSEGNDISFENGAYHFSGKKTIYISYDSAPEEIKNFCKACSEGSGDFGGAYSIYINGYLLTGY